MKLPIVKLIKDDIVSINNVEYRVNTAIVTRIINDNLYEIEINNLPARMDSNTYDKLLNSISTMTSHLIDSNKLILRLNDELSRADMYVEKVAYNNAINIVKQMIKDK